MLPEISSAISSLSDRRARRTDPKDTVLAEGRREQLGIGEVLAVRIPPIQVLDLEAILRGELTPAPAILRGEISHSDSKPHEDHSLRRNAT